MSNNRNLILQTLPKSLQAKILSKPPSDTFLKHQTEFIDDYTSLTIRTHKRPLLVNNIDNFDGPSVWKGMITDPLNQGDCGSCWAFASVSCLSDRFNIQSAGKMHVVLSPIKLLLCNFLGSGIYTKINPEKSLKEAEDINRKSLRYSACFGNSLVDAYKFLFLIGTNTIECTPLTGTTNITKRISEISNFESVAKLPLCSDISGHLFDMCSNFTINPKTGTESGTYARFFRAFRFYGLLNDEIQIRDEIYKWGPVASGMVMYPDFYDFDPTKEVYSWNGIGPVLGGHAIVLVGWGIDDKYGPYWIVKNSWGVDWGINGYFKIVRGKNMCDIESNIVAPVPDFFFPSNYTQLITEDVNKLNLDLMAEREKVTTSVSTTIAGGINPENGYSRRIAVTSPMIDLSPPINLNELPNWKTFVAGELTTNLDQQRDQNILPHRTRVIIITVIVTSIIIALAIMALVYRKRLRKKGL